MLIYAEDFASPMKKMNDDAWDDASQGLRFGGDALSEQQTYTTSQKYFPNIVPYFQTFWGIARFPVVDGTGRVLHANSVYGSWGAFNPHMAHLRRSKNLTFGMLFERAGEMTSSYYWDTIIGFSFHSYLDNLATNLLNFTVTISLTNFLQKANIGFKTGGDGYPDISPQSAYYDFNQPVWIWVQCDMTLVNPGVANGVCRVWFNNDLVATKEDIYTGDSDEWPAQPLYAYNNAVRISCNKEHKMYALAAVNEGLTYMDSALGDIHIAGLLPTTTEQAQWGAHHDGVELEKDATEVLQDNVVADYADLHTKEHIRADEHLAKDMYQHQNPFYNDSHIIAVAHRIVHRKYDIASGASVLRIEPIIETSGRDPVMHRNLGQLSEGNTKTLFVNYIVPYAGAFWTKELLDLTIFGFAYFDAARPERTLDGIDFLDEYDVENLDDGIVMEVVAQDDDYLLGGTIRTHILDETFDLDISAIDGDEA